MARKTTGAVVEHTGRDGHTYRALRFTAYGKRRYMSLGAVSAAEADRTLRHTLADVERGVWAEPRAVEPPPEREPVLTFHQLAEEWWVRNEGQLRPNTQADYRWRLERHLLPHFADERIDRITFDSVERYIAAKLAEAAAIAATPPEQRRVIETTDRRGRTQRTRERSMSSRSINMTLVLMAAILEGAVDRELIARNPARGRKRRARERAPRRTYLHTAGEIRALLDAGGQLDAQARSDRQHVRRRAMLSVLVFAGLRIGELCALRWRDVDLAAGWLSISDAKTDAGMRRVKIRGALRDELSAIRPPDADPAAFVFATATGRRPGKDNVRNRVLAPAVELGSASLVERGLVPLPEGLTPHSLRRTFASVMYALGEDPGVVMDEMGHTSPALALRIYRQAMRRDESEKQALRDLIDGAEVAVIGRRAVEASEAATISEAA